MWVMLQLQVSEHSSQLQPQQPPQQKHGIGVRSRRVLAGLLACKAESLQGTWILIRLHMWLVSIDSRSLLVPLQWNYSLAHSRSSVDVVLQIRS